MAVRRRGRPDLAGGANANAGDDDRDERKGYSKAHAEYIGRATVYGKKAKAKKKLHSGGRKHHGRH